VDEAPDRAVIDLEPTLGKFGHKPTQGEVFLLRPLQQPSPVRARNRLRLVPAHLARRYAPGLTQPPHPVDGRADAYAELRCRLAAGHPASLNRRNHPLAKIDRIRFAHPCRPPFPASMLNQNPPDLGIQNRFRLNSYRSRVIVAIESHQRAIDMQVTTIGLDIAKNVFQVHGIDAAEKVVVRKQLRRSQVLAFFKALPPCLIGMEACATAHYWARELTKLGH
jgi:hypothetical protein